MGGVKNLVVYMSSKHGLWFARAEKKIASNTSPVVACARLIDKLGYCIAPGFNEPDWKRRNPTPDGREEWHCNVVKKPDFQPQVVSITFEVPK